MGLNPGSPGSRPGLKAGAKPLSHWAAPEEVSYRELSNYDKKLYKYKNNSKSHPMADGECSEKDKLGRGSHPQGRGSDPIGEVLVAATGGGKVCGVAWTWAGPQSLGSREQFPRAQGSQR